MERKEVKGECGSGGNLDSLKEAGKGCEKMRLHAGLKLSPLACTNAVFCKESWWLLYSCF